MNNFLICAGRLEFADGFPVPSAAPSTGAFIGNSPLGAPQGCGALYVGAGSPFGQPPIKARNAGITRVPGVFSFGYVSLDKQRNVPRLSVREPT
jgi:hypothetical protein